MVSTPDRVLTPGSGCQISNRADDRCGGKGIYHIGKLQCREDGTWSCAYGAKQAAKNVLVTCSCGCGEMIEAGRAHRVNPVVVEHHLKGEIVLPKVLEILFPRFTRVVRNPGATVLLPDCAAQIAAGVNPSSKLPGFVQTKKDGVSQNAFFRLFVSAAEAQRDKKKELVAAEARIRPIVELIEEVLRGGFVKRGEPFRREGVSYTVCATAANNFSCLGEGSAPWAKMPAWRNPAGTNSVGFCPACADAVAHRFAPMGFLEELVTGRRSEVVEEVPEEEEELTFDDFEGSDSKASVHTGDGTPADRVRATIEFAKARLDSRADANRIIRKGCAILARFNNEDGVPSREADRLDAEYASAIREQNRAKEAKGEQRSNRVRIKVTENNRGAVIRFLRETLGATDEDFKNAPQGETPKELLDRLQPVLAARKAAPAEQVTEPEVGETSAPEPTFKIIQFAQLLAEKTKKERPHADPNDRHYAEAKPAAQQEGGKKKPSKKKAAAGKK